MLGECTRLTELIAAEASARNHEGKTPLDLAEAAGRADNADLLRAAGAQR